MPAIDLCEPQVIRAFEKAGWVVTDRPFDILLTSLRRVYADFALQNQKQQIIIVEVKCFPPSRSMLDDLYHAIGQYVIYQVALLARDIYHPLYLIVPTHVYHSLFELSVIQSAIEYVKIKVIVVDLDREEIVSWRG